MVHINQQAMLTNRSAARPQPSVGAATGAAARSGSSRDRIRPARRVQPATARPLGLVEMVAAAAAAVRVVAASTVAVLVAGLAGTVPQAAAAVAVVGMMDSEERRRAGKVETWAFGAAERGTCLGRRIQVLVRAASCSFVCVERGVQRG